MIVVRRFAASGEAQHRDDWKAQATLGPESMVEGLPEVRPAIAHGLGLDGECAASAGREVVEVSAARLLEVVEDEPA